MSSLGNSLAVFSVAYNNLSGKTLEKKISLRPLMKTVTKKIFFLCGSPLGNNCNEEESGS
jgi:hypothetical protein